MYSGRLLAVRLLARWLAELPVTTVVVAMGRQTLLTFIVPSEGHHLGDVCLDFLARYSTVRGVKLFTASPCGVDPTKPLCDDKTRSISPIVVSVVPMPELAQICFDDRHMSSFNALMALMGWLVKESGSNISRKKDLFAL